MGTTFKKKSFSSGRCQSKQLQFANKHRPDHIKHSHLLLFFSLQQQDIMRWSLFSLHVNPCPVRPVYNMVSMFEINRNITKFDEIIFGGCSVNPILQYLRCHLKLDIV